MRMRNVLFAGIAVLLMGLVSASHAQAAIFYDDDFESTLASKGWDTGSCNPSDPNPAVNFPDGCNPKRTNTSPHTGSFSLQGTYTGLDSGAWIDHTFQPVTEVYHRFYYQTRNFAYNSPGTKNFATSDGMHYPNFWINHYEASRQFSVYMQLGFDNQAPCTGPNQDCIYTTNMNASSASIPDNQWFCVEDHVKFNTPGQANGVIEMWINGIQTMGYYNRVLVSTTPDCNSCASSNSGFNFNRIFVQHGVGTMFYDNFAVGTTRIGCSGSQQAAPAAPTGLTVQ